jgi:spore coat polysaccharide biosynthesis protein SpsF
MFYLIYIQARMSSRRFPGKVLAPLAGRPVVGWLIERVSEVVDRQRIVLATSTEASDDPLATYAASLGVSVFRGELDNVVARFQACLKVHSTDWFVRICADSPLLDPALIKYMAPRLDPALDLVTNVQERTFPRGQSIEFINARAFSALDASALAADEQEHVTQVFYRNPGRYRIANIAATDPAWARLSYVVDSIDDLRAIEKVVQSGSLPTFVPAPV